MISLRIAIGISLALVSAAHAAPEDSVTAGGPTPSPSPLVWLTDLQKATVQAKAEGKLVLLFFHGAGWCPPCVQMQRQVIESPEFVQFARQSLVLLDVDFPEPGKQSQAASQANLALKRRFNLSAEPGEGFPTLVLLNDAGQTVFQETGYDGGGPAEVLSNLRRHKLPERAVAGAGGFRNLTVDEFAQMTANPANVILDVRTAKEFEAGHLPGAVNVDVTAADFEQKAAALDKSKVYLVHCASGVRSVKACENLGRLGFAQLYNLPGGFRAWAKAGKTVEK
jgi:phage shock protein E